MAARWRQEEKTRSRSSTRWRPLLPARTAAGHARILRARQSGAGASHAGEAGAAPGWRIHGLDFPGMRSPPCTTKRNSSRHGQEARASGAPCCIRPRAHWHKVRIRREASRGLCRGRPGCRRRTRRGIQVGLRHIQPATGPSRLKSRQKLISCSALQIASDLPAGGRVGLAVEGQQLAPDGLAERRR